MIKTLVIKNFILIDDVQINFEKGFNVITGETGAGKSIIIKAIDSALGSRSSKEHIKTGKEKALIELEIELPKTFPFEILKEQEIEIENNILTLTKEITQSSTKQRVNGTLASQSFIQKIKDNLIDIHSQHQTYSYMQPKFHIDLVDNYADENHKEIIKLYKEKYEELNKLKKKYKSLKNNKDELEKQIDFLNYKIEEIEKAEIIDFEEDEKLEEKRERLVNADELKNISYSSYYTIYEQERSLSDVLSDIENKIIKASEVDKTLEPIANILAESSINLKDVANELRNYSENLEVDPKSLFEIEERINILDKLKRKYGPTLSDVNQNFEKFQTELAAISGEGNSLEGLEKQIQELEDKTNCLASKISKTRENLANELSQKIENEIKKLEMPNSKFFINVEECEALNEKGKDEVEFFISPNAGEPLKALSKIASGGEVSRIMLAIKTIFAKADKIDTVIFDEIDTGISGKTSQVISEEIADLSKQHQVICITHQAIIASMADNHIYIVKTQSEQNTSVNARHLNENDRIKAIAKLSSGFVDNNSIALSKGLLRQAELYKKGHFSTQY